jgi:dihydrofolate reductase
VLAALPVITAIDLVTRQTLRMRLRRQRKWGRCLLSAVAVGDELAVADLVTQLRWPQYHGLTVVGACVAQPPDCGEVAGVPVYGGLDDVTAAVKGFGADTVVVLAYPEMDGVGLRDLACELEKTGIDLYVAPDLADDIVVPRTAVRLLIDLSLLRVEYIERQVRVGKDGRVFSKVKFRTMVVDAEQRKKELLGRQRFRRHPVQAGDAIDAVAQLKESGDGTLVKYGNGPFSRALVEAGLLDELHLSISPFVAGSGKSLLSGISTTAMNLTGVTDIGNGAVVLAYTPSW